MDFELPHRTGARMTACTIGFAAVALVLATTVGGTARAAKSVRDGAGPRNEIALFVSLDGDQVRDDLLVPMRFAGPGFSLGTGWQLSFSRFGLRLEVGCGGAYVMERDHHPGLVLSFELRLTGLYRDIRVSKSLRLDVGLVWRSRITDSLLSSWDDAHLYYLASHVGGPALTATQRISNGADVVFGFRMPMLGVAGRPLEERFVKQETVNGHYLFVAPHEHVHAALPGDYLAVEGSVGLTWRFRRSRAELRYTVDYERDNEPQPFRHLVHRLVYVQDIAIGGKR